MKKSIWFVFITISMIAIMVYFYSKGVIKETKDEYEDVRDSWNNFVNKVNHKNDSLQVSIEVDDSLTFYFNQAKRFRRLEQYDITFEDNEYKINNHLLSLGIHELSANELLNVYNQKAIEYNYGLSNLVKILLLKDTQYREPFDYFRTKYGKSNNKNPIELQRKLDKWIETGEGNK